LAAILKLYYFIVITIYLIKSLFDDRFLRVNSTV